MKHLKSIVALTVLAACLIGCGGKPSKMDDNTYNLGCKALEIMEDYNKMEISNDEAYDQLDEIYNRLSDIEYDEDHFSEELQNGLVKAYVLSYKVDMTSEKGLFEDTDNLRKTLNK